MTPAKAAHVPEATRAINRTRRVLTPANLAARSLPPIA